MSKEKNTGKKAIRRVAEEKLRKSQAGRPSSYRPEYCEMLKQHMAQGFTLKSFAGLVDVDEHTVHNWLNAHPEFLQSKKNGEAKMHLHYEKMGQTLAMGHARRVKSETPKIVLDKDGNQVVAVGPDGRVVMVSEYEYTTGGQTTYVWLTKNLLNYTDRQNMILTGDENGGPIKMKAMGMTDAEKLAEITEMMKAINEIGHEE